MQLSLRPSLGDQLSGQANRIGPAQPQSSRLPRYLPLDRTNAWASTGLLIVIKQCAAALAALPSGWGGGGGGGADEEKSYAIHVLRP